MKTKDNTTLTKFGVRVNMCIAFVITILIMILVGYIIHITIPDTLDIEYIEENYIKHISNFVAEQSERMQYGVLTILFPLIYILVILVLHIFIKNITINSTIINIITFFLLTFLFLFFLGI